MASDCFHKIIERHFSSDMCDSSRCSQRVCANARIDRRRADKQQMEHYDDQEPRVSIIYMENFETYSSRFGGNKDKKNPLSNVRLF